MSSIMNRKMNRKKIRIVSLYFLFLLYGCVMTFAGQSPFPSYQRDPKTGDLKDGELTKLHDALKKQFQEKKSLPVQVFLEVNVFEVLIKNQDDIGFIYNLFGEIGHIQGNNLAGDPVIESNMGVLGSGNRNQLLPTGANINATFLREDDGYVHAVFQALAEDQIVKVHSNPILITVEGVSARLVTGDIIPFLARASLGNVETVVSDFRSTGVTLEITPYVGFLPTDVNHNNPYIMTEIDADLSTVSRFREEEGFAQPIVDTRQFNTSVWLKDGNRILIGGIFRDSNSKRSRGIPLLKDIPLLGRIFRSSSNISTISQLYIMIRPSILDIWGDQSFEESLSQQEQDYRRLRETLDQRAQEIEIDASPLEQFRELFLDRSTPE